MLSQHMFFSSSASALRAELPSSEAVKTTNVHSKNSVLCATSAELLHLLSIPTIYLKKPKEVKYQILFYLAALGPYILTTGAISRSQGKINHFIPLFSVSAMATAFCEPSQLCFSRQHSLSLCHYTVH